MISNHHTLILSLLPLMAYSSSLWTEGRQETSKHHFTEENITRALIDMTQESLLRSFGIDVNRKPSKTFTPHDYMIDIYSLLSGNSDAARKTRINTVRGIMDTGKLSSCFFQLPVFALCRSINCLMLITSSISDIELFSNEIVSYC